MIADTEFDDFVKNNNYTIVKFTADWCDSCKKYNNYIGTIDWKVLEVDYDLNEDLVESFEVKKLPTLIIYKNGINCERVEGFIPKTELLKKLNEY